MTAFLLSTDWQQSVLGGIAFDPRAFSPYGFMQARSEPVLGFCGQHRGSLTGQYLLGNGRRSYSPVLMRFFNPDKLSPFDDGGLNAYAYCSGDPINRIDPNGQVWRTVMGAVSSMATVSGAVVRTARNEALRLQHQHRTSQSQHSTYTKPSLWNRLSNIFYVAAGTTGIAANATGNGWTADGSLITLSNWFGVVNSGSNIAAGVTSNFNAAKETWALMGQPGIPSSSVVFGTFAELSGIRMMGEAASFVGRKSWDLAGRIAHTAQGAYQAWRQWGGTTQSGIEMHDIRQPDTSRHV